MELKQLTNGVFYVANKILYYACMLWRIGISNRNLQPRTVVKFSPLNGDKSNACITLKCNESLYNVSDRCGKELRLPLKFVRK